MKKQIYLLCICTIFLPKLHAQDIPARINEVALLQSSFTQIDAQAWAAGGAYVTRKNLPAAAFLNPASLNPNGLTLYLESGKRFKSDYVLGLNVDGQFILPAFAGISKSVDNFAFSAGYANFYNFNSDVSITVTTAQDPDGVDQTMEGELGLKIHSFHAACKYQITDRFAVGITGLLNYLKEENKIGTVSIDGSGTNLGVIGGGLVDVSENLSFGLSFRYNTDIEYEQENSGTSLLGDSIPGGVDRGSTQIQIPDSKSYVTFPWSSQAGLTYTPAPTFSISVMLDYKYFSENENVAADLLHFHAGIKKQVADSFVFSAGFFTKNHFQNNLFRLSQNFLTAGISLKATSQLEVSATVIDAHLLTEGDFQQTYIMAGLQYQSR